MENEKIQLIQRLLREGKSYSQIREIVHCSMSTISRAKKMMNSGNIATQITTPTTHITTNTTHNKDQDNGRDGGIGGVEMRNTTTATRTTTPTTRRSGRIVIDKNRFFLWIHSLDPERYPAQAAIIRRVQEYRRLALIEDIIELIELWSGSDDGN